MIEKEKREGERCIRREREKGVILKERREGERDQEGVIVQDKKKKKERAEGRESE